MPSHSLLKIELNLSISSIILKFMNPQPYFAIKANIHNPSRYKRQQFQQFSFLFNSSSGRKGTLIPIKTTQKSHSLTESMQFNQTQTIPKFKKPSNPIGHEIKHSQPFQLQNTKFHIFSAPPPLPHQPNKKTTQIQLNHPKKSPFLKNNQSKPNKKKIKKNTKFHIPPPTPNPTNSTPTQINQKFIKIFH